MTAALPKCLARGMETSATGYAAVIDGVLNIRTVAASKNEAALNAVYAMGYQIFAPCTDPDCGCMVEKVTAFFPGMKIVPVRVTEVEDD